MRRGYDVDYKDLKKQMYNEYEIKEAVDKQLAMGRSRTKFTNTLKSSRLVRYIYNRVELNLIYDFLTGVEIEGDFAYAEMVGAEFDIMLKSRLEDRGPTSLREQVLLHGTRVDVEAYFNGFEDAFTKILPDLSEETVQLERGLHAFEAKAHRVLCRTKREQDELIKQIQRTKGKYSNIHIVVLKDTRISEELAKRIYAESSLEDGIKVDVIQIDITFEDIFKRLRKLRRRFRKLSN